MDQSNNTNIIFIASENGLQLIYGTRIRNVFVLDLISNYPFLIIALLFCLSCYKSFYLNVFIWAYNLIMNRMTRNKNMMENINQIGLKFGRKLIYHLYIPRDIFEVYKQMRKLLVIVVFISVYALMDINLLCSSCLKT